jgi:hypothetical protein
MIGRAWPVRFFLEAGGGRRQTVLTCPRYENKKFVKKKPAPMGVQRPPQKAAIGV